MIINDNQQSTNKIALEVQNLKVKFNDEEILKNISFKLEEGTITALIGPNGSGKSVLLKTILGIYPYEGKIKIFGEDHSKMLHLVGYLPQYYHFEKNIPITVYEFIAKSYLSNHPERIDAILKEIGIFEIRNKLLSHLSGGQLERVLLARSLVNNPKILLLDEPTSETDIIGQKNFYDLIELLSKNEKTTILIVSHEITVVHTFAQKVLCLNRSLICDGPVTELFKKEILEKLYHRNIFIYPFNKPE